MHDRARPIIYFAPSTPYAETPLVHMFGSSRHVFIVVIIAFQSFRSSVHMLMSVLNYSSGPSDASSFLTISGEGEGRLSSPRLASLTRTQLLPHNCPIIEMSYAYKQHMGYHIHRAMHICKSKSFWYANDDTSTSKQQASFVLN